MIVILHWKPSPASAQELLRIPGYLPKNVSKEDSVFVIDLISKGARLARSSSDSALICFKTAYDISDRKGFTLGIVRSLHSMGTYYLEKGESGKAVECYRASLKKCSSTDNGYPSELPVVLNNLGSVYLYAGQYDTASRYFYRAAYLGEQYKVSPEVMLSIYNNLASLMDKMGEKERFLAYLDKAVKIAEHAKNPYVLNIMLYNKGLTFRMNGRIDSARVYLERSLTMSRQKKFTKVELASLLSLGNTYKEQDKRNFYLQQAVDMIEHGIVNYRREELATLYDVAEAYMELGNHRKAEEQLQYIMLKATESGANDFLLKATELSAGLYAATGRPLMAYNAQKRFSMLSDSLLNIDKIKEISSLEAKYNTVQKDKEIAENKLSITLQKSALRNKDMVLVASILIIIALLLLFMGLYRLNKQKQRTRTKQLHILQQQQEIEQLKAMMTGEERERSRLAKELHDGIGGMLASVSRNLDVAKKNAAAPDNAQRLETIMNMVYDTSSEVRKTAHNLMPDVIAKYSLVEALVIYCDTINTHTTPEIEVQCRGQLEQLSKTTQLMLYRITQELVQNILKHAAATHAVVQLVEEQGKVVMFVEDDGKGFVTGEHKGGYGLQNLRHRVLALGGELEIMSEPGRGTTIHIEFKAIT